jgi:hypothetical protein
MVVVIADQYRDQGLSLGALLEAGNLGLAVRCMTSSGGTVPSSQGMRRQRSTVLSPPLSAAANKLPASPWWGL